MKALRTVLGMTMFGAVALTAGTPAMATESYTGNIEIIEVWNQGNVAFRLSGVTVPCANNNWMVINKSSPGAKTLYAALMASKLASKPIRVSSPGCGPAEGYGPTPYLQIDYLYMID